MWDGINRRKFPRVKFKCFIFINKKGSSKSISTNTENIGAGGICVIIKDDLGLFQGVELEINIEDNHSPIKCSGTVVWVVKKRATGKSGEYLYDTGIEFVDIDEQQRERIIKVVDDVLEKEKSVA